MTGTNTSTVTVNTNATGGNGGTSLLAGGSGGAATATTTAVGHSVTANAKATGGAGPGGAGVAVATATGAGQTGSADAHASSALPAGARILGVSGDASTSFAGSVVVSAETLIGAPAPVAGTDKQALAFITGAPVAPDTSAVIAVNPDIAGAIGGNPVFLGLASLGGSYAVGGSGPETMTSVAEFNVALDSSDLARDLVVGLYGGKSIGADVTNVSLDIKANGIEQPLASFSDSASAVDYFKDNAVDVGSLRDPAFATGNVDLVVTLKVTTDVGGSGFFGSIIVTG
jgi:hypothetical protein